MKIKRFFLFLGIIILTLASCDSPTNSSSTISGPPNVPPRLFWAANIETGKYYQLEAELLAESSNCRVWVEKGSGVSSATAASMAKAYEDDILPKMMDVFVFKGSILLDGKVIARNTMELADWMGDGDGKFCILLLDIKDGFKPGDSGYVGGYFWGGNLYGNDPSNPYLRYSNECDMIYIDCYPGRPGSRNSNSTFAHEMQHMLSFVCSHITERYPYPLDTWIDEGLSESAGWVYLGSHDVDRWTWYNDDPLGTIQKGNNFFVWDNHNTENSYAVLDDYATTYLFFQWLRLQAGNTKIYSSIIMSDYYDQRAVTSAASRAGVPGANNWPTLLKTWLAANYINAPSGPYGYRNDSSLKNIQARTAPAGIKNIALAPGEAVYSITDSFTMPENTQYINYAGLNKTEAALSDTATFSGGALLTYNVNTNILDGTAPGTTTGVASDIDVSYDIGKSALNTGRQLSGPFVIGARDFLKRNGNGKSFDLELKKPYKGIFSIE